MILLERFRDFAQQEVSLGEMEMTGTPVLTAASSVVFTASWSPAISQEPSTDVVQGLLPPKPHSDSEPVSTHV